MTAEEKTGILSGSLLESPVPTDTLHPQFTIEPFVGLRVWQVITPSRGRWSWKPDVVLRGNHGQLWNSNYLKAECVAATEFPHESPPPYLDCFCGIYAVTDEKTLHSWTFFGANPKLPVLHGPVELWGRVLEGTTGYRGEHCRMKGPMTLTAADGRDLEQTLEQTAELVAAKYEVDVAIVDWPWGDRVTEAARYLVAAGGGVTFNFLAGQVTVPYVEKTSEVTVWQKMDGTFEVEVKEIEEDG